MLLFRDRRSVAKQCWVRLHSSSNSVGAPTLITHYYKDVWVVSFARCTAGPNIVESCCICLHITAKTDATTNDIVGATMLGVVASVYMQPKRPLSFLQRLRCFEQREALKKSFEKKQYTSKIKKMPKLAQILEQSIDTKKVCRFFFSAHCIKPRVNGRNIVGQQLPTLLDVTCCFRLRTLLHVVACCCAKFETSQTLAMCKPTQQLPTLFNNNNSL